MNNKTCTVCNETKDVENFYKHYSTKDKLNGKCKDCFKLFYYNFCKDQVLCECGKMIRKPYLETHKNSDLHKRVIGLIKKCSLCQIEKPYEFFSKTKSTPSGLSQNCKNCHKVMYLNNKSHKSGE